MARPLTVTLTFDDAFADQMQAQALLKKYGMRGTFYVNSGTIDLPGYMTRANLDTLKANGHEIGGHSVTHPSLPTLPAAEQNRQICRDRNTLSSWGYTVTSFAYPFVDFDASTKAIVQECGYNSGRAVGDLRSPYSCSDCPTTEPIPPADRYEIRTPDETDRTWSQKNLRDTVTRAERDGGWLVLNIHHICATNCVTESITPKNLEDFLKWLKPRSSILIRTTVKTVHQTVGGAVRPAVVPTPAPPAGDPGVNTARNPSLETPSNADPTRPDCWTAAGFGTNTRTFARVADAHSGSFADRITMTSRTDGDAKLVQTFDLGNCASTVTVGRNYEVSAWYKSNVEVYFTLYKRDAVGRWAFWTLSPRLAPAAAWTHASWVSPPVPSGAEAASFGLTIDSVGTLTTDDYGFADAPALPPPAPPGVNALKNPSLETAGVGGFPQCWTGTGFGTNTPVWTRVTDAAHGTFAQRLDMTSWTDGDAKLIPLFDSVNCAPTVTVGHPYTLRAAYKSDAPTFFTLYRQDTSGVWSYWTGSPPFAASAAYTAATWVSPPVPAGTVAMSFGLTLSSVGSLTTDDYSLVDSS